MLLHDSLLWAIGDDGASGLYIYCEDSIKEEVAQFFDATFRKEWHKVLDKVEEEYGDCYEKDEEVEVVSVSTNDTGVFVSFECLAVYWSYGECIACESGDDALRRTLKKFTKKYPDVQYEGYIGYTWSDLKCGETVQYEIRNFDKEGVTTYDFVGQALADVIDDEDLWGEEISFLVEDEEEEELTKLLKVFFAYQKWIGEGIIERFIAFVEEENEALAGMLQEKIELWNTNPQAMDLEEEEDDSEKYDNLPDGYMEMLDLVSHAMDQEDEDE